MATGRHHQARQPRVRSHIHCPRGREQLHFQRHSPREALPLSPLAELLICEQRQVAVLTYTEQPYNRERPKKPGPQINHGAPCTARHPRRRVGRDAGRRAQAAQDGAQRRPSTFRAAHHLFAPMWRSLDIDFTLLLLFLGGGSVLRPEEEELEAETDEEECPPPFCDRFEIGYLYSSSSYSCGFQEEEEMVVDELDEMKKRSDPRPSVTGLKSGGPLLGTRLDYLYSTSSYSGFQEKEEAVVSESLAG
ncbi:hypothetical protein DFH27DRAFT_522983 [Peziza echinospora]|nr:hypothetical protein DFH27DRAFT_522983 [Peziza echinospora]